MALFDDLTKKAAKFTEKTIEKSYINVNYSYY